MTNRTVHVSPQVYARTAGVLYLINIACGIFGEIFVRGHLIVAGDAAATAHNIISSEFLFRSGTVGDLIMHITDVPMTLIFYVLLRPVSRDLSLLSALFSMLQTAILCANKLNLVTVLLLLEGFARVIAAQQYRNSNSFLWRYRMPSANGRNNYSRKEQLQQKCWHPPQSNS